MKEIEEGSFVALDLFAVMDELQQMRMELEEYKIELCNTLMILNYGFDNTVDSFNYVYDRLEKTSWR